MKETSDMQEVKDHARLLYNPEEVESALDRMAGELAAKVSHSNPILLAVMNGGLILLGMLLPRLDFPLRVDYLHATRYRERTFGTDLQWKKTPEYSLAGETVVVVDDILDEGYTLKAIVDYCKEQGAAQVISVVLVQKIHQRGNDMTADIVGLTTPDEYLFGYGMDYKGYWRNASGIYFIEEGKHD
ncbi:hypoxanthine-guanine phosphoribosyltransferase [Thiolapillus sp.]|uniref:hypoxanthine-guanine phosphoribosyltransferase n=1 Tax=Thiolapillus sp. TaxID=2017437 RepID=UPI003AF6B313